jgi:regulatory protein
MPKITNFTPQIKNQDRVNVFIDDKYAFSLDIFQVSELGVKVGQELSEEELENLKKASDFGKLYARTLGWLISRPHSKREVKDYLRRKKTEEDLATAVMARLEAKSYLDDARFARFWVENRFQKKGVSRKRLQLELIKKGISQDLIASALESAPRDDATEIDKILAKKAKRYEQDPQKLLAYLVRQGFSYDLARAKVEQLKED